MRPYLKKEKRRFVVNFSLVLSAAHFRYFSLGTDERVLSTLEDYVKEEQESL
jgi:hypothetical protein